MICTMPSTALSVSILNSTLTSDPLFGRTCLLICHDDTRRDLRHPAKIYSPECVEEEFSEVRGSKLRSNTPDLLHISSNISRPFPITAPHRYKPREERVASSCHLLLVGFPRISRRCCPGRVWVGAPQSITNTPREISTPTTNSPIAR